MTRTLWTPWRMEHVLGRTPAKSGCIFDCAPGSTHDKSALMLYRDLHCVVLLNRFPYANGHLLVAPARHTGDLTGLHPEETQALMLILQKCVAILGAQLRPDGFNIGLNLGSTAGAGISDHLHFHVVPRWDGDHNFMTVTAEIRTIPQHIDHTFDQLLPDFQALLDE